MKAKHIINPIPDSEWKCPSCGDTDNFYIEESADCGIDDCEKAHEQDIVVCYACNGQWTLKTIINKWIKKNNMIQCPHCKGSGYISPPAWKGR